MSTTHTPAKHKVVRKISADKLADFDEHWWPITLLLLGSAAGLAGYIYKNSPPEAFTTEVWHRNTWVHIGAVGVVALILLIGTAFLRGSQQRRLQLGVFLSLAFHVGLLFLSREIYLKSLMPPPPDGFLSLDDEVPVTIPDYIPAQTPGDTTAEVSQPTDTRIREEAKIEVAPQTREQMKAEKDPITEPDPKRTPEPTPTELARVELSAPRRNDVLSGEKLSRRELEEKLRMENATPEKQAAAAAAQQALAASVAEIARREAAAAPSPQMNAPTPRAAPRTPAEVEPMSPSRRDTPDQTASADTTAALARKLATASPQAPPLAPAEAAAARANVNMPLPSPQMPVVSQNRQAAQASSAQIAPSLSPAITNSPAMSSPAAPARAESPQPNENASAMVSLDRPQRVAGGAAPAGAESATAEPSTAPTSTSAAEAGGGALEAQLSSVERGNQGTPQQNMSPNTAPPSPLGAGNGPTVGAETTGMRRADAAGDGNAGLASATPNFGRPGRSRAVGSANSPTNQISGGEIAAIPGPAVRSGNAAAGGATGLMPATPGTGAGLGERTAPQSGAGIQPSAMGGTTGLASAPTGGMIGATGSAAGGSLSGAGNLSGSPNGSAAGTRRDVGDSGDLAGSATGTALIGTGARGRSSAAGNAAGVRAGDGMVAASPIGSSAGSPSGAGSASGAQNGNTPGGMGQALDAAAGGDGLRRGASGIPVLIAAPEGPGGLTSRPAADIGLPSRRARPESEVAHLEINRLLPERLGGKKSGGGMVRDTAVTGLKQRDPTSRGAIARTLGGSEQTEQAVELGLEFLARHQSPDGSWKLHDFGNGRPGYENAGLATMESNTAGTGLALLAFLGAGYTHHDEKYGGVIEKGLTYLLKNQRADGDLWVRPANWETANTWLYSHGIASIALCEALGMTRDDALLKAPAQKALDFIVAAQEPTLGGWRYRPGLGSDTSVSGWQLMALKSGERVGLQVPPQTYALVTKWLNFAQGIDGDPTRYAYRPQATEENAGEDYEFQRRPSRVMTAEALLMRQYLGWTRDHKNLTGGADFLLTELPTIGTAAYGNRDSYYWYYATQVMFHMKGKYWSQWNEKLRPILVDNQVRQGPLAGSWSPGGDVPDRWGGPGGRLYLTAMNLLMLEVYYRYLPLYQNLEE